MGDALSAATDSLGYSCEADSQRCGSALLVVHHAKHFVLRPGKAARNVPKCHYSCLYRSGVFVFVVAQPI